MKLRDDLELRAALMDWRDAGGDAGTVLDALERAIDRRTPAAPPEQPGPLYETEDGECHCKYCEVRRAATPGTAPAPSEPTGDAMPMPSLINQLMMGADAWMQLANHNLPGLSPAASRALYEERSLRARQYRERAERIRYWTARAKAFRDNPNVPLDDMGGPVVVSMLEIICGEQPPPVPGTPRGDE